MAGAPVVHDDSGARPKSRGLPVAGCCSSATPAAGQPGDGGLHARLADLLSRYNVNDYAASVRVYAVKR
jgi:hypothetical protein